MTAGFCPSPDFIPGDGDEPHVRWSRDNPCRPADPLETYERYSADPESNVND